jgi:hypothetical protein
MEFIPFVTSNRSGVSKTHGSNVQNSWSRQAILVLISTTRARVKLEEGENKNMKEQGEKKTAKLYFALLPNVERETRTWRAIKHREEERTNLMELSPS